ncbi:MAG: DJ-1/PfpI family protein [Capsulimonadaceae bacterium]|nr:DJ-1/PfpI family protein [Capsulimonadaceae bacterium]
MTGSARNLSFGLLMFPDMTQLDLTGPYEVFSRVPDARTHLLWKTVDPVQTDRGLIMLPTATLDECPPLDLICVPGGPGQVALMSDETVLAFLRKTAQTCRYITSVCTGSLVLGAAGLLTGYRATTHWASLDQLSLLGARPVAARVVFDRNRITGAGVTSGIDFALAVTAHLAGEDVAKQIQLQMEYDPVPPFDAGSPGSAGPAITTRVAARMEALQARRREATLRAADALQALGEP